MRGGYDVADLVALLARQLDEHDPVDDIERVDIERFRRELDGLADPFSRDAQAAHITGSGFVVGPRGIVLHHHRRFGMWLQPGGHVDAGETPWEAARREVVEETGIDVAPLGDAARFVHLSVHDVPSGHVHYDLRYLFDGGTVEPNPPPGESPDVHWFDWPAAIERAEPDLTTILTHLAARLAPTSIGEL